MSFSRDSLPDVIVGLREKDCQVHSVLRLRTQVYHYNTSTYETIQWEWNVC